MMRWISEAHGLRFAALRYFNVAGATEGYGENHEPESHLIPIILDVAMGRRANIKIYGNDYPTVDGTCVRDYIHVADLANAHLMALQALSGERRHLVYNIGNGQGFTVLQVIESARRVTGHAIPVEICDRRPGDPAVLVASSEAIQRDLGWRAEHPDLDDIIGSAWNWHQKLHA
jgi:UDP-glucose 4-epimerase